MTEITRNYDIMLVGAHWTEHEEREGRPFVGGGGPTLKGMLRNAGIDFNDCYSTYVFNQRPQHDRLESFCGDRDFAVKDWPRLGAKLYVSARYQFELDRLFTEIATIKPKIIIALGATALWALTKQLGIKKARGTPTLAANGITKVLPTYAPGVINRQWKLRPICIADLSKAREESLFPELRRPERFVYMEPTIDDIAWFYEKYIEPADAISADIETKQFTITEIGFAPTVDRVLVIPFYDHDLRGNYWKTPGEEFEAWKWVMKICEKPLIGQNFSYDIQYLWSRNVVQTPLIADDTMILHHAMYPEMEKSLGFLGSIYTKEPSWKFMRQDNETLKAED